MSAQLHPLRGTTLPQLLIIGDIALFREGIENGLTRTGEFCIVGSVDVREAVEIVGRDAIDVAVLDTSRRRASSQARQLLAM
jgi:DNA-binding NarL/FixJ family response regulator